MFARAVDARERLLVQQAREAVLRRHPLHRLHRHHLMVGGHVRVLEDRRDLVLARRDLVVPRLHRDADLVQLALDVVHERQDALGNGAEVLILELLPLRRACAEERPAGVDEIGPVEIEVAVDQEVLLLGAAGRDHALGARAEEPQDAQRLLRERLHRAEQRRLLVERLAGPAHERGRDDQRAAVGRLQQPRWAGRIPRRVTARLERGPHAAGWEARRVRLAFDELPAAELGDGPPLGAGREKRVVLLGRDAGHRLEPVRVVRRAMLDGPVLQRGGDDVGRRRVERLADRDRAAQGAIDLFRQTRALNRVVERQAAEEFCRLRHGLIGPYAVRVDGVGRAADVQAPFGNAPDGLTQCCGSHCDVPLLRVCGVGGLGGGTTRRE
jgi:hypothetical protein